jgi:hypothetical protein
VRYYDLSRNWTRRIVPHLQDKELNEILVRDFNKFTFGRWRKKFKSGNYPEDFESCDWRLSHKGKEPRYWRYVKHAACHWIVNFTLRLAMLAEPNRKWRIISSDKHSTVWDGEHTLFDFNFQALGISPEECFQAASQGRLLKPGKYLSVYFASHYSVAHLESKKEAA